MPWHTCTNRDTRTHIDTDTKHIGTHTLNKNVIRAYTLKLIRPSFVLSIYIYVHIYMHFTELKYGLVKE